MALFLVHKFLKDARTFKIPSNTIRAELLYTRNSDDRDPRDHLKDLKEVEGLLKGILKQRVRCGEKRMIGFTLLEMTQLYINWAKRDPRRLREAKRCLRKGYELSSMNSGTKNYFMIGRHERNKGQICFLEGKRKQAKFHYRRGIAIIDNGLPTGNFFSQQFKGEYKSLFTKEYVGYSS